MDEILEKKRRNIQDDEKEIKERIERVKKKKKKLEKNENKWEVMIREEI